jgi:eukaryotic-like serine/threonine-protein kinase
MMDGTMHGYVLGEMLGRGGMGAVYAAWQPSLGRAVAVKLLHPELAEDPRIVDQFFLEATAGSRLSHPNLAGAIDVGVTDDGQPFLVMERVRGERLGAIVAREGALPVRTAGAVLGQVLSALDAAHRAGVVHADVKSDNVLIDVGPDGREVAVLIDFGIARLTDRPPPPDDPTGQTLSGTPAYLAPELIAGAPPTVASDIYAAGIVLYELLCGSTPFRTHSTIATLARHLEEDAVPPSLRSPDAGISAALDRVVLRAVAKDPALRFATAAQFAAALLEAMPGATRARPPRRLGEGTRPYAVSRTERGIARAA